MRHSFPHDLSLELARKATDRALQSYVERLSQYQPQVRWLDDRRAEVTFSALGKTLRGNFELDTHTVHMEMRVPLLLRPFRNRALEVIGREIGEWIERARNGELDESA